MKDSEIFINRQQLETLKLILKHISESLNECHYLSNVKGIHFTHKLSGLESFIMKVQVEISYSTAYFDEETIKAVLVHVSELSDLFTCGGHRLEVKLFNSLYFQQHLLSELQKLIYLNRINY